jgi:allantoate deiminase/N-carbamoyl-L-amino-acid hydrolase
VATLDEKYGVRILGMADQLAQWSEMQGGLTCTYFSPAHKAVAEQLRNWMRTAGLEAQIDAVGNVVGRYASAAPSARTLIVGSHYDTVANAGRYDGRLGILTALVVAESLVRARARLPFHLEVIGFSEEEGVRFSAPYIGSSAVAGRFNAALLRRSDSKGISLGQVLHEHSVDLSMIDKLARPPGSVRGYLEVHIEQGPQLLERNLPLGIVTSIAGVVRCRITVEGVAGHAGTVPMTLRHDAAAAAAEIVLAVERRCAAVEGLVGTVGQLEVPHGLINVIPGRCEFSLDVRSSDDKIRDQAIADIRSTIEAITRRRGVTASIAEIARHPAVPCAPAMQAAFAAAITRAGIAPFHLASGAGHDAEQFSGITDIGMLFVRCGNGGISHNPRETITADDADAGARVLLDVIGNLN